MTVFHWVRDLIVVPDRRRPALTSLVFGMTLRLSGVVLPVYMRHEGQALSTIGLVVAASGLAQLLTRPWLSVLLRRFPDRSIILCAIGLLIVSGLAVLAGPFLGVFVVSQLLQGSARALYWTASQTYVVRGRDRSATALAEVNFASSVGQLAGPALAGFLLGESLWGSVLATGICPLLCLLQASRLDRHDPFPPRERTTTIGSWRTGMVRSGCWAGVAAGAWEGLAGSYLPILLLAAGFASSGVGLSLSAANLGGVVGGLAAARLGPRNVPTALWAGAIATGLGLACTAAWADHVVIVVAALGLASTAAGMLRTLGPAAASDSVPAGIRGDALTATGTYRAVALVVVPALVGGIVAVTTLPVAVIATAVVIAGTGVPTWWWARDEDRGDAGPAAD